MRTNPGDILSALDPICASDGDGLAGYHCLEEIEDGLEAGAWAAVGVVYVDLVGGELLEGCEDLGEVDCGEVGGLGLGRVRGGEVG